MNLKSVSLPTRTSYTMVYSFQINMRSLLYVFVYYFVDMGLGTYLYEEAREVEIVANLP